MAYPSSRLAFLGRGTDRAVGERIALGYDETMARCILGLYRDAAQPAMAQLGAGLPAAAARPGLTVLATEDRSSARTSRAAGRGACGRTGGVLDGLGHWWMARDPERAAAMLVDFWSSLSS